MSTRTELGIGADVLAGTCAIAIGIGLARFDFSILAKQMATAGWIDTASIGDLSGGNLIGYLIGCFHQSRLRRHQHVLGVIALALVLTVVSMLAEGFWSSTGSQAVWRFVGGWAAAQLMTGVPSLALRRVPARQLRLSTAIVMGGAGLGGLLGALAVGLFAPSSPRLAWILLAGLSLLLSLPIVALLLRNRRHPPVSPAGPKGQPGLSPGQTHRAVWPAGLILLAAAYAVAAMGSVPSVFYEPLLLSQRFGAGPVADSHGLAIFGAGAMGGSLLVVCLPRAWATRHCLVGVALAGVAAATLFAWGESQELVVLGSFLLGCWTWMIVSLTHLRIHDFVPSQAHRRCWATCTLLYGLGLMLVSFASSGLASSNLQLVLVICLGLILLHAVLELLQCRAPALPDQGLPLRTAGDP